MQVTVFGAAGALGGAVVDAAAMAEHDVTAVVPDGDAAHEAESHGATATVVADPYRGKHATEAVSDADAVVFVPDRHRMDADALSVAAVRVADAMEREGVRRFVSITGAGARNRPGDRTVPLRLYDAVRGLRGVDVNAERAFAERIADADLDWTIVRAARLTNGPGDGVFQHGYRRVGVLDAVSRANAASFVVTVAESDGYVGGMPIVTEKMEPEVRSSGPLATGAATGR